VAESTPAPGLAARVNRRAGEAVAIGLGPLLLAASALFPMRPGPVLPAPRVAQASPSAAASPSPVAVLPTPPTARFRFADRFAGARVRIDELGIDLPVVRGDGVNVPLYMAAIFPALAPPGDGGRSMIYAHARDGMFGNLLLRGAVGQHVEVTLGNGTVLRYVIRQYYKRWPISDTRWLQPLQRDELILETCTSFNSTDPRVIAVAEPV
jgi:hypothetical protein